MKASCRIPGVPEISQFSITLWLALILAGCGSESSGSGSGMTETGSRVESSHPREAKEDQLDPSEAVDREGASGSGGALCLTDCDVTPQGVFRVTEEVHLTASGCTLQSMAVANTAKGVAVLQNVNCEVPESSGIYLQELQPSALGAGLTSSFAHKIQEFCGEGQAVSGIDLDHFSGVYSVVALCRGETAPAGTLVPWRYVLVTFDRQTQTQLSNIVSLGSNKVEDLPRPPRLKMHPTNGMIGVFGQKSFWRYDANAVKVGGTLPLDTVRRHVQQVLTTPDSWVVIRGSRSPEGTSLTSWNSSTPYNYCSKIDLDGVLRCDRKRWDGNLHFSPAGYVFNHRSNGGLESRTFLPELCGAASDSWKSLGAIGSIKEDLTHFHSGFAQVSADHFLFAGYKGNHPDAGFLTSVSGLGSRVQITPNSLNLRGFQELSFHKELNQLFLFRRWEGSLHLALLAERSE